MSKTLIYLIAIFALWMYFSFGTFDTSSKNTGRGGGFSPGSGRAGVTA